jgi:hypothetical protein
MIRRPEKRGGSSTTGWQSETQLQICGTCPASPVLTGRCYITGGRETGRISVRGFTSNAAGNQDRRTTRCARLERGVGTNDRNKEIAP